MYIVKSIRHSIISFSFFSVNIVMFDKDKTFKLDIGKLGLACFYFFLTLNRPKNESYTLKINPFKLTVSSSSYSFQYKWRIRVVSRQNLKYKCSSRLFSNLISVIFKIRDHLIILVNVNICTSSCLKWL